MLDALPSDPAVRSAGPAAARNSGSGPSPPVTLNGHTMDNDLAVDAASELTTAASEKAATLQDCLDAGGGTRTLMPPKGHLVLSQARLASFATPAGDEDRG